MARHGRTLLRTANHWSICHDDALDAYQRALEIFLRRADSVQPETEVAWLKVVIKHEALAIRRARSESVSGEEPDLDARVEPTQRPLDEQVAGGERVSRSAEALRALKPDERRALMLKAQGYSYQEIGEHFGWTYTKVNRSITEGRRRFMQVFQAIESGEACEAYLPTIAALAGGSASSAEIIEIRPHLRHCSACRATVRQLHVSAGTTIKLLLPGFVLGPLASIQGSTGGAAVAPADDALDQDQLAVLLEIPERSRGLRLGSLRDELLALLHRTNGSDAATGVYIATSGGGGRISTIATVIGFCVSSAGAGALCVATGVVEAPRWILGHEARPPAPRPIAKRSGPHTPRVPAPTPQGSESLSRSSTMTHRQSPTRDVHSTRRKSTPAKSSGTARQSQDREFGFEQRATPPLARQSSVTPVAQPPSNPHAVQTQQEFGP